MHSFVRNLITEWRRLGLPFSGETIVVAVSGGADSVSLLLGIDDLKKRGKLDLRIVAAHFDHKLRPETSSDDLDHVRELTVARHIELAAGEWKRTTAGNLEQDARQARYAFLQRTAENVKARFILTGHTMNDQAETVLMNLIRGSGPDGLGGMRPIRQTQAESANQVLEGVSVEPMLPFPAPAASIARPMLCWAKRRDTEEFCRENEVEFSLDPMNEDMTFRRVWIRKVLLPMLEEVNPKMVDSLCRTAELLQNQGGPPASAGGKVSTAALDLNRSSISLKELRNLESAELRDSLRSWIKTNRGNLRGLQLKHIEAIERLIHSRKSGKTAELPGKARVVKARGQLVYSKIEVDI